MKLALAIPTHNDHAGLERLLRQAADMEIFEQVVVVDDGSTPPVEIDATNLPFQVKLVRHDEAQGPGAARIRAMSEVDTSHLLFFDSDDLLGSDLVSLWQMLQDREFDFCLFRHDDSRNGGFGGQMPEDEALWQRAGCDTTEPELVASSAVPFLARTANYPWNKIYRLDFLREHKLSFSDILMHEDMELHWKGFLNADRILASTLVGAQHFVVEDGTRLTNRRNIARLRAFGPMQQIYQDLRDAIGPRDALTIAYLRFLDGLWHWIDGVTDTAHKELLQAHKRLFLRACLDDEQQNALLDCDPVLAESLKAHQLTAPHLQVNRAPIKVHLSGHHAKRTPLSYAALAPLFENQIVQVSDPVAADVIAFAHNMDLQDANLDVVSAWRDLQRPVILLSEEPFWDTIWGARPLDPVIVTDTSFGALPVRQISHQTSDLFRFDKIPYYLLTNHRFARAYQRHFQRNATRSALEWQEDFAKRPASISYMFERRPEPYHWVTWPEGDLIGLCSWRTELAEACRFKGVERLGRSWDGRESRLTLGYDWHMDKLTQLDGHARMIGAVENTHQPQYITEKFFDAFACGAMPVYYASPQHRIHDFGLPQESWVNLYGLTPEEGAEKIAQHEWNATFFEAFREAQNQLYRLFGTMDHWRAERARWAKKLPEVLEREIANPDRVKRPA
ncbi:putative glycosyl transferase [Cognatishimia activa]|uniref:Putative glycosyl transferase n=1 Tax=Cognatishimia activa TaxID=1715691 RepID=A0A0P1IQF0_9RHOB|nr:glycosyltransferase family 2 protein [Cognatishimia activa]CUK25834.1 putative glycosyl transferase [Cognatishimia activa]